MALSKVLSVAACVLTLCASMPSPSVADQAQYIYDGLGRLSQVIHGHKYDVVDATSTCVAFTLASVPTPL